MRRNRETTIAETADYRIYTMRSETRYFIEYADRDPMAPIPWYSTLEDVQEALYYAGLLEAKDSPLG